MRKAFSESLKLLSKLMLKFDLDEKEADFFIQEILEAGGKLKAEDLNQMFQEISKKQMYCDTIKLKTNAY